MSDPPGTTHHEPKSPNSAPTENAGAVSTTSPAQARTSAGSHTTNSKLREQVETLTQDKRRLEQEKQKLARELARVKGPIEAQLLHMIQDRFEEIGKMADEYTSKLADVDATQAALSRDSSMLATRQQAWDEQIANVQTAGPSMADKNTAAFHADLLSNSEIFKKALTIALARITAEKKIAAQHKETTAADKSRNDTADYLRAKKLVDSWYKVLHEYDSKLVPECRRKLLSTQGYRHEVKYALSDPLVKDMCEEEYLTGFLHCLMDFEYRSALNHGVHVEESRIEHLRSLEHERNHLQVGERVAYKAGWRILCREQNRPDWDTSLSTREWTSTEQFWNVKPHITKDGFFTGVHKGWEKVKDAFQQKLDDEYEAQQFRPVSCKYEWVSVATNTHESKQHVLKSAPRDFSHEQELIALKFQHKKLKARFERHMLNTLDIEDTTGVPYSKQPAIVQLYIVSQRWLARRDGPVGQVPSEEHMFAEYLQHKGLRADFQAYYEQILEKEQQSQQPQQLQSRLSSSTGLHSKNVEQIGSVSQAIASPKQQQKSHVAEQRPANAVKPEEAPATERLEVRRDRIYTNLSDTDRDSDDDLTDHDAVHYEEDVDEYVNENVDENVDGSDLDEMIEATGRMQLHRRSRQCDSRPYGERAPRFSFPVYPGPSRGHYGVPPTARHHDTQGSRLCNPAHQEEVGYYYDAEGISYAEGRGVPERRVEQPEW